MLQKVKINKNKYNKHLSLLIFKTQNLSDPVNCEEEPCHLAWIFSLNLLKSFVNAECSNGTFLKDLDPEFFIECYVRSGYSSKLCIN